MTFVVASNNQNKVEEISRMLKPLGLYVKTAAELGTSLDDVEESGEAFKENAEIKAKAACEKTGLPAIADDSGLVVDALGGRPGVYSARYAGENASDEDRINKLLSELCNSGSSDRTAHFECVMCCYFPNGEKIFSFGSCEGTIGYAPRGTDGFGYDPIFFTDNNKTFAELTDIQKDAVSHRGRAIRDLVEQLGKKFNH